MTTKGKQAQVTLYLPPELAQRLKRLSDRTRVPQARYFREAVNDILVRYDAPKRESARKTKG